VKLGAALAVCARAGRNNSNSSKLGSLPSLGTAGVAHRPKERLGRPHGARASEGPEDVPCGWQRAPRSWRSKQVGKFRYMSLLLQIEGSSPEGRCNGRPCVISSDRLKPSTP
jgi:hypothetical protein